MGVRIYLYAIDLPHFEVFLTTSLRAALWRYTLDCGSMRRMPTWYLYSRAELKSPMYAARHKVSCYDGQKWVDLTIPETEKIDFLAQSARDYLASRSNNQLRTLLDCFGVCPGMHWVEKISGGHRRWWIGSLLQQAERLFGTTGEDYQEMARLFQVILRGYDCGKPLPPPNVHYDEFEFPLLPPDNRELRMGVWTDSEVRFMVDKIDAFSKSGLPDFKAPLGRIGIAPDTDHEWNQWVRERVHELRGLKKPNFSRMAVVSFITTN